MCLMWIDKKSFSRIISIIVQALPAAHLGMPLEIPYGLSTLINCNWKSKGGKVWLDCGLPSGELSPVNVANLIAFGRDAW